MATLLRQLNFDMSWADVAPAVRSRLDWTLESGGCRQFGVSPRTFAGSQTKQEWTMLRYALIFLVVAVIASAFGMFGLSGAAMQAARILFIVFLVMLVLSYFGGRRGGPRL